MKKIYNNVLGITLAVSCVFPTGIFDNVFNTSIKAKDKTLNTSLVSYYSFDHENTNDEGKGGRNGVLDKSKATFEDGKSGKALYVTTASKEGAVKLPKHNQNDKGNWTVSYWVKADQLTNPRIAVMADESKTRGFNLRIDQDELKGGLRVGAGKPDKLTFQKKFESNVWYNILWTQDTTKGISMYVDGKHIQTMDWTAKHDFVAPLDIIGAEGFTGYIDEVKIYDKVLNQQEIADQMLLKGLNLNTTSANVIVEKTYQITTNLISDNDNKDITFTSKDETVATVDSNGLVTAKKPGTTKITVENKAGGFREDVTINVNVNTRPTIARHVLPEKHLSVIEDGRGTKRQYLGQPDMVRTKTGRLITVYPVGHGHGPLVMQISDNDGETWTEKTNTPKSWEGSQETPTLYKLNMKNGKERLMLITACPGWGTDSEGNKTGWNTSYSDDDGETWTEYKHWYSELNGEPNKSIVGMASLIQLKDDNGNYKQEWMGVYHNYGYVNYKTILTFDKDGNEQWSEPVPYLSKHRDEESSRGMCEIGMFRSPDGKRIVGLARSDKKTRLSSMIYSDDEGKTWSKPVDLPGSLSGERHKALYDPISGRLVIAYREIDFDRNLNGILDDDWMAGEWIAWVGSYEQLMNREQGDYNIELSKDYAQNPKSGDTGYTGMIVLDDGTFVMDSYGHWDEEFSKAWRDPKTDGYNVKTDLSYIKQAKFKLGDIESKYGLVKYDELNQYVGELPKINKDEFTISTYNTYKNALDKANEVLANKNSQQIQVNQSLDTLKNAKEKLVKRGDVTDLGKLVENNSDRIKDDYKVTEEQWAKFTDALTNAQAIVNDNSNFTQADVDAAKVTLEKEVEFLEQNKYYKEDMTPITPSINIGDLKDAIEKPVKEEKAYTIASWETYQEALAKANKVLANKDATQEEIDAVTKALQDAYKALKENPGVTPLDPSSPVEPEVKPDPDGQKSTPENEKVENTEKPNTGVSTNTALLWTVVLGAGVVTVLLVNKKRKAHR